MESRVLIFGDGLLGMELGEVFPGSRVVSHKERDIRSYDSVWTLIHRESNVANSKQQQLIVINAAAYTDVDKAETEPKAAFATNALGVRNVAQAACRYHHAQPIVVHISTNAVFDGADGEFDETSAPKPASVYGYTKRVGEEYVIDQLGPTTSVPWYIVRTGFLYGKHGKNFGSKLFGRLRAGERVPADPIRLVTPTWARPVAEAIRSMIEKRVPSGIYHAISDIPMSWHRFGLLARQQIPRGDVEGVPFQHKPGLAPRPKESIMVSRKLQMFDITVPSVAVGMGQAIEAGI